MTAISLMSCCRSTAFCTLLHRLASTSLLQLQSLILMSTLPAAIKWSSCLRSCALLPARPQQLDGSQLLLVTCLQCPSSCAADSLPPSEYTVETHQAHVCSLTDESDCWRCCRCRMHTCICNNADVHWAVTAQFRLKRDVKAPTATIVYASVSPAVLACRIFLSGM